MAPYGFMHLNEVIKLAFCDVRIFVKLALSHMYLVDDVVIKGEKMSQVVM